MPPRTDVLIQSFAAGDDLSVTRPVPNMPTGRTLIKGWFTVKKNATDVDPGLLQKVITTAPQAGVGQITDPGADGTGEVLFELTAANTAALGPGKKFAYDIQLKLDDGEIVTLEIGDPAKGGGFILAQGVTAATS